jgi:hypothetical protein
MASTWICIALSALGMAALILALGASAAIASGSSATQRRAERRWCHESWDRRPEQPPVVRCSIRTPPWRS